MFNLFKKKEKIYRIKRWVIWDKFEGCKIVEFTTEHSGEEEDPQRKFGGPWGCDRERYEARNIDILTTMNRLGLRAEMFE